MPDEREPVFERRPTGDEIARWFRSEQFERRFQNVGGDATWLSREPHGWVWHLATVDHDDQVYWLLVIGTDETQDLLFVTAGLRCALAYEWRNQPSKKQDWGYIALMWMAARIEHFESDWAGESAP